MRTAHTGKWWDGDTRYRCTDADGYDLLYPDDGGERYNALLLRLAEPDRLEIAFDPAPTSSSRCAALLAAGEPAWITTYVR